MMFEAKLPRDFEKRQNEPPNRNMIGFKSELLKFPKYQKLSEINGHRNQNENREVGFYCETTKLLGNLRLSLKLRDLVLSNIETFFPLLQKGSYNRGVEILTPVSIYISCLENFVFVNRRLFYAYCSKKAFNKCLKAILRNNDLLRLKLRSDDFRIKTILGQLSGLSHHFNLSKAFFTTAARVLLENFELLKNSKTTVITAKIYDLTKKEIIGKLVSIGEATNFLGVSRTVIYYKEGLNREID